MRTFRVDPHSLTGGSLRSPGSETRFCDLPPARASGLDWLTVTVPTGGPSAQRLQLLPVDGPGASRVGFASSEARQLDGATVWRHSRPHQSHATLGRDFETWEAAGRTAHRLAELVDASEAQPSRVDVAFDHDCPSAYTSDDFAAAAAPVVAARRLTLGISGQDGVNTRYVGSARSARRVRIYRKDLQNPAFASVFGPLLRVELVMRSEFALRWWSLHAADPLGAQHAAASMVGQLTGFCPLQCGHVPLPPLETPPATDAAQRLFSFVSQHGPLLEAAHDAGVDLVELARLVPRKGGRMAQKRRRDRLAFLTAQTPRELQRAFYALLSGSAGRDCSAEPRSDGGS